MITDRDLAEIDAYLARQRRRRARHYIMGALASPAGIIITAIFFALIILS